MQVPLEVRCTGERSAQHNEDPFSNLSWCDVNIDTCPNSQLGSENNLFPLTAGPLPLKPQELAALSAQCLPGRMAQESSGASFSRPWTTMSGRQRLAASASPLTSTGLRPGV